MSTRTWIVAACLLASAPAAAAQALAMGPKVGSTGATTGSGTADVPAADELWVDLGYALAGEKGEPILTASGSLAADSSVEVRLANARAFAPTVLVISDTFAPTAFKGGLLAPNPATLHVIQRTDVDGTALVTFELDTAVASGVEMVLQFVIQDPAAVEMYALSNALSVQTP